MRVAAQQEVSWYRPLCGAVEPYFALARNRFGWGANGEAGPPPELSSVADAPSVSSTAPQRGRYHCNVCEVLSG